MPLIETKGAASAQGFGIFGRFVAPCCLTDGNKGIFAIGNSGGYTTTREKYTYATDSSTAAGVGAASVGSFDGAAAGNNTRGIFSLGNTCGVGRSNTRNKYTYSGCTSTASGVASASCASNGQSATGNSTRGIFAIGRISCSSPGCNTNKRDKYTYSSCTSTSSGVGTASISSCTGAAAGNSTRGIFQLGGTNAGGCRTNVRNKYTYACCTSTASGVASASNANFRGSAAGNSTRGIFALGFTCGPSTTRNKYTYASCTSTASGVGAASSSSFGGAAAGNSTRGIFALGSGTTTRNKYTYACCTSTASGVAASCVTSFFGSAASWASCVNT